MPKDESFTDTQHRAYRKAHDAQRPLEIERGQVQRERTEAARGRRQSKDRVRWRLRGITSPEDAEPLEDDAADLEEDPPSARTPHNAAPHKRRLKDIAQYAEDAQEPDEGEDDT